jgi:predicted ArsR family transcriptional regulator
MGRERDDESGKYTHAYSDEDFVQAIETADGLAGTGDIADAVGCSHRQALNRLKELERRGVVISEDVGKSLIWRQDNSS